MASEGTTNALKLTSSDGALTKEIFKPTKSIEEAAGFKIVQVINEDQDIKSFYIVYGVEDYSPNGGGPSALVPPEPLNDMNQSVNTTFVIRSAKGYDMQSPGIVLFQHPSFCGPSEQYRSTQPDITASFPPVSPTGVSSIICTGGEWKVYDKRDSQGSSMTILPGQILRSLPGSINDRIMSVKFIK